MEKTSNKKQVRLSGQEDQKYYQQDEYGHIPYLNLGRLYASRGLLNRAVIELEHALVISPGEPYCLAVLKHLRHILN
jgi:hypothetical protein